MSTFLKALGVIAISEMGDKTQLLTLAFAARLRAVDVLAGVLLGTLANHALAVSLGGAALLVLPAHLVKLAAGAAFVGFALWTLRGDELTGREERPTRHPVLTVAVSFFLAEMGDKTQLATAVLAAEAARLLPVWLGSTLGMLLADGLAVAAGTFLGHRLPERPIRIAAAVLLGLFGLLLLAEGLHQAG